MRAILVLLALVGGAEYAQDTDAKLRDSEDWLPGPDSNQRPTD
jgi:hypothetical protein